MRILLVLSSLLMLAACSSTATSGSTASSAPSDNAITRSIQTGISSNSMTRNANVNVHTENGTVTLTGHVRKDEARDHVVEIATNTDGVVSVDDQIEVSGEDE